jgi:hypothetical protein
MLTVVGCGGSESKPTTDGGGPTTEAGVVPPLAALNVAPSSVNLGSIDLGNTGTATVIVTNTGTATSGALAVVASAGITTTGCTGTVAAHGNCTMIITAAPTAIGGINGTVSVSATPGAITPLLISVTGTVVQGGVFNVSPATIDLGNVLVGAPATKQTITVSALVALSDLAVLVNGADITKDATSTCTAAVAVGTPCTVVVNFAAASNGARSNSVVISAKGVTKTVPITANAQNPAKLVVSPSSPQSLVATVGQPSSPVVFGVSNSGDLPTGALTVAVTGLNKADFVATPGTGCTLIAPLGASCTISVVFTPTAVTTTAAESATLTLTDTGTGASTVSVTLSGTAYPLSNLQITPATTDMGTVLVGSTGAVTTFTVTNSGGSASGALTVSLSSAEFVNANDTCSGTSLAPAGTCTIAVQLKPTSAGGKSATLLVAGTDGLPVPRTLTGTGITNSALKASPASLDFQTVRVNKTGAAQTVTVTNGGGVATGALTFTKGGADFAVFPIASNTCSAALAPGATCTFSVSFAPTLPGSFTATYTVTDGVASATVSVSGVGAAATGLSIGPQTVTACPRSGSLPSNCINDTVVGGTSVGLPFTVTADSMPAGSSDTGAITATLIGANLADFTIVTNNCKTPLLLNGTCTIIVSFTPSAVGLRQAGLSVTSANGGSDSSSFQVNGLPAMEIVAGPPPALTIPVTPIKPADLDFGQVPNLTSGTRPSKSYTVIVRGPTGSAAPLPTTTVTASLANTGTPSDFNYLPVGTTTNPCTGTVLTPSGAAGAFATGTNAASWSLLPSEYGVACTFQVEFFPQTGKGTKTATISASGTALGSPVTQTLTGQSTGPLTITPNTATFPVVIQQGESSNDFNLTIGDHDAGVPTTIPDLTFVVKNEGAAAQGPLALALGGTDSGQFHIVSEDCSLKGTAQSGILAPNTTCSITVAFSPTSTGAKTGSLTVTASGTNETATATFTANAAQSLSISASPTTLDLGSVVETASGPFKLITVSNPAGALPTGQITYVVTGAHAAAFPPATAASASLGSCGVSGHLSLAAGQQCTIAVQLVPAFNETIGALSGKTVLHIDAGMGGTKDVVLTGTVLNQLSVSPATLPFGNVASDATSAPQTLTITNLGAAPATLTVPTAAGLFSTTTGTTCGTAALAPQGTCVINLQMSGLGASAIGTAVKTTYTVTTAGTATAVATLTGTPVSPAQLVAVGVAQPTVVGGVTVIPTGTIDLGGVQFGSSSGSVVLTYGNTGGVPTTPVQFQWTTAGVAATAGTVDPEFAIGGETGSCFTINAAGLPIGKQVQPGTNCTVTITFTPVATVTTAGTTVTKLFTLSATSGGSVAFFNLKATALASATPWLSSVAGSRGFSAFAAKTPAGVPVTLEMKFTNGTTAPLTISTVTLALAADVPSFTSNFAIDLNDGGAATHCAATGAVIDHALAAGQSCTFLATFNPSAWAADSVFRWASVTATQAGAGGFVVTEGLFGQVQAPAQLTVLPVDGTVGTVQVGEVVAGQTGTKALVVTNIGQTATKILAVTSTGSNMGAWTADTGCNVALAAGDTCTVNITVQVGSTTGAFAGTITVSDTAATPTVGTTTATATMNATVVNPALLTLPVGPLNFATAVIVGNTSAVGERRSIVVTNGSGRATTTATVALDDQTDFTIVSNGCLDTSTTPATALTLAGGDTCTVTVDFIPQSVPATGVISGHLTIVGTTASVTLTGTAKSTLSFGSASAAPAAGGSTYTVTKSATPATGVTAFLTAASLGGTDAALFAVITDGCYGSTLSASDTCQVTVQYIGGTVTGTKTATLTVSDGTSGNTAVMTLNHP